MKRHTHKRASQKNFEATMAAFVKGSHRGMKEWQPLSKVAKKEQKNGSLCLREPSRNERMAAFVKGSQKGTKEWQPLSKTAKKEQKNGSLCQRQPKRNKRMAAFV